DSINHRSLARVRFRNDQMVYAQLPSHHGHREDAFDRAQRSVERQLAQKEKSRKILGPDAACRPQDPNGHREIERRAFLLYVRGRQIDRDALGRQDVAAVAQCGLDPLAALPDRRIRQPHGHEIQLLPRAEVHFDSNRVSLDTENGSGADPKEHLRPLVSLSNSRGPFLAKISCIAKYDRSVLRSEYSLITMDHYSYCASFLI